jgi:SAM-dependent methyltransferase
MWDERYRTAEGYVFGTEPNAFLAAQHARLKRGWRALCPGDGEGRNGVWLAQQGLDVLSVDLSSVGLDKALDLASARGVRLMTLQADLTVWQPPEAAFDLVAACFVHLPPQLRPGVHAKYARALKPGGLLILEGFHPDQRALGLTSGGPKDPQMLFAPETLRADFSALSLESCERVETSLGEGPGHQGRAVVTRLVARKP